MLIRHLFETRRNLNRLADIFYWPILDLALFGFISVYFQQNVGEKFNILAFFIGALIFWSVLFRVSQDITVSFLEDVWSRNLLNIAASPITNAEYIISTILLGLGRIILTLGIMMLLALLLYSFNIFFLGFWLALFFINLLILGWTIGIIAMSLVLRFGQHAQFVAWTLPTLIQPFSAVFYPLSVLPEPLRAIGRALPSTYVFEGIRGVISGGSITGANLAVAFGLNIIYLGLAVAFFSFVYKTVRKKGLISKLTF